MHRLSLRAFLTALGAGERKNQASCWLSLAAPNYSVFLAWWDQLAGAHPSGMGGLQHPIVLRGVPERGGGTRLCVADADKPSLLRSGVREGGRRRRTGCLVAVIRYGEGELGACTRGLGLQQEEGKGVISWWPGSPAVWGKELASLEVQLQAGHRAVVPHMFSNFQFPSVRVAIFGGGWLVPQHFFQRSSRGASRPASAGMHPVPRRGWLLVLGCGGHPALLFPPLCTNQNLLSHLVRVL